MPGECSLGFARTEMVCRMRRGIRGTAWRAGTAKKHFRSLGMVSFFGHFVSERAVPRDHFLVTLNQLIDL